MVFGEEHLYPHPNGMVEILLTRLTPPYFLACSSQDLEIQRLCGDLFVFSEFKVPHKRWISKSWLEHAKK
jgi:hypothetical protein